MGIPVIKCPLDLWIYQEIVNEIKPDLIIETGTYFGGSAYFLAGLCDLMNKGEIISIDIDPKPNLPQHKRITYLKGSSISEDILKQVRERAKNKRNVIVMLDSDHRKDHVLEELRKYSPLVTPGSYLIVEDTYLNGHPWAPGHGPGPMEAVNEFLAQSKDFEIDLTREKFVLTMHPRGFLKRAHGK